MHVGRVYVAVASVPPMAAKVAVSCWLPTVLGPVFAVAVLTALLAALVLWRSSLLANFCDGPARSKLFAGIAMFGGGADFERKCTSNSLSICQWLNVIANPAMASMQYDWDRSHFALVCRNRTISYLLMVFLDCANRYNYTHAQIMRSSVLVWSRTTSKGKSSLRKNSVK